MSFRLKERDKVLFGVCIQALKSSNKGRAEICANEVSEIRKLILFLYSVDLAIESVILRLETVSELSDIMIDLKPALKMLQKTSKQLFEFLPNVSTELGRVNDVINETLCSTRLDSNGSAIPINVVTQGGEEILKEVSTLLEQRTAEKLPEPPVTVKALEPAPVAEMVALTAVCSQAVSQEMVDTASSQDVFSYKKAEIQKVSFRVEKPSLEEVEKPSLEEILLEYVRKSAGEIDLMRCSLDLEASFEEVKTALETLGAKGKIKIEVKTR